jgi:hypothetical protein
MHIRLWFLLGVPLLAVALFLQTVTLASGQYESVLLAALALTVLANLCFIQAYRKGGLAARCFSVALLLPTLFVVADFGRRSPYAFGLGLAGIPARNRAVLQSGDWTPTRMETQKALRSIQSFLENASPAHPKKSDIAEILANSKRYRVQFIGVVRNGKKIIFCNFFRAPRRGEEDDDPEWKREKVVVEDGGFWYWRINYEPSEDKASDFACNGYA